MDNNTKFIAVVFGLALVLVAGTFGLVASKAISNQGALGASEVNYSTALSNASLWANLDSIVTDLGSVRAPLAGLASASASWAPSITAPTSTTGGVVTPGVATTTVTVSTAAVGDFAMASFDSTTSSVGWTISAKVSTASSVLVTITNLTNTAISLTTSTLRVRVLPQSSFAAPAALGTTATSTR